LLVEVVLGFMTSWLEGKCDYAAGEIARQSEKM